MKVYGVTPSLIAMNMVGSVEDLRVGRRTLLSSVEEPVGSSSLSNQMTFEILLSHA